MNSLDDGFESTLAQAENPNHAAFGFALGSVVGVVDEEEFDGRTRSAGGQLVEAIGEPDHLVILMLDGFGMNFVETLPEDSYVRQHVALEMSSVVPTSTGPNLMSIATGRWPGQHGNMGWDTYIPRLGEKIEPLTWRLPRTGESLESVGFKPHEMLLSPLIPFGSTGSYTHVAHEAIAGSTTTKMYGPNQIESYSQTNALIDIVEAVTNAISRARAKSLIYVYFADVDHDAHTFGEFHPNTRDAVLKANELVEAVGNAVEGEARLVATADHGHVDSPDGVWETLTPSDAISESLACVPAGEPRAMYFHCKPDAREGFPDIFNQRFGDRFTLMRSEIAVALGIFGDPTLVSDAARARLGDYFALSKGRWCIYPSHGSDAPTIKSMHGGITKAETVVPVIIV